VRGGKRPIIVAVSGGADSTCLLDAVTNVVEHGPNRVIVGHVNHQMRPESADDAEHVRVLTRTLGVGFEIATADVPAFAHTERIGLEEAARTLRYRALSTMVLNVTAVALLTGHTRSDNVETVLMHLIRGSGQRGLAGIAPEEYLDPRLVAAESSFARSRFASVDSRRFAVTVVRPLLEVDRAETSAYCLARGLPWRHDPSNAEPAFVRNRIRQHLLPVLRTYNPNIDTALARLAETSRDDESWLSAIVTQRIEGRRMAERTNDAVSFDLVGWRKMPVGLCRRVIRRVANELDVRDLGFDAVELALSVADEAGPTRVQLSGGIVVSRVGGRLVFERAH
jgi:tRNA(Ile)-lysidine synthetase-like protein